MKVFGFLAQVCLAARVDRHALELETGGRAMMMAQSVSMANGFLNFSGALDSRANKICDSIWPDELSGKFRDKFVVGSGATACVFLGYDSTNTLVAIKVGKGSSGKGIDAAFASWKAECDDMQSMRMKGCRAGKEILQMHEQYLPTCTDLGKHKHGAYYVMHAAGTSMIKDAGDVLGFSTKVKQEVFAQLVASTYALHAVDLTHNDLHGQNIVLDGSQLALIDFGSLKTLERSWKRDYKRDSNAIWRWGAVLGNCPAKAQWPNPPTSSAAAAFLTCMKDFSGNDPTFMSSMKKLVDGDVKEGKEHFVGDVFKSNFLQTHLPAQKSYYPWVGTGDCLAWSKDKWSKFEFDEQFPKYRKCDTLKTFKTIKTKTKKGKTRVTETLQCNIPGQTFDSACYSNTAGKIWACGGCAAGIVSADADGGCLFPSHPGYKFAV